MEKILVVKSDYMKLVDERRKLSSEVSALRSNIRRDLAGLAMQGLLADPNTTAEPPLVARVSVQYADALLAELEKSE